MNGIRCAACAATFFPAADRCPRCATRGVETVALAPTGVVTARTGGDGWSIGEVTLDDGVLVLARLAGEEPFAVGDRVRYAPEDDIVRFEHA